jgi:putative acetyltransferase
MRTVEIQPLDAGKPEARRLIEELDGYLTGLYPSASNHLLPVEALREPHVVFLVARIDGRVAGCGAYVNQGGEYAEIKRMYVVPEFRGLRIGRRMLEELEVRARGAGLNVARLETGVWQPEALGLYERAGYQRRGPFGSYCEDPLSVFMEKKLTASNHEA